MPVQHSSWACRCRPSRTSRSDDEAALLRPLLHLFTQLQPNAMYAIFQYDRLSTLNHQHCPTDLLLVLPSLLLLPTRSSRPMLFLPLLLCVHLAPPLLPLVCV